MERSNSADRFIPARSAMNMALSHFQVTKENNNPNEEPMSPTTRANKATYKSSLQDSLFSEHTDRVLAFKKKAPAPSLHDHGLQVLYNQNKSVKRAAVRQIPQHPFKVLDSPEVVDDYYLNLMDWSSDNLIAVGLDKSVFVWNASNGDITHLMRTQEDDYVTSVSWQGSTLAVGLDSGGMQIWDVNRAKRLRTLTAHTLRATSLAWNRHVLTSGSRDSTIVHHDVRVQKDVLATLTAHKQEVCGLRWSSNGQLASGGNDNLLCVWDEGATTPKFALTEHTSAIKALAWCPWQANLLASGGGTGDRKLRFWNTQSGTCVNSIDTHSQTSAVQWSPHSKELVTAHGYSKNQLTVWSYPSLARLAELEGHTSRVLQMALSPDGTSVASLSGDESIKLWKVFEQPAARKKKTAPQAASLHTIR